MITIVAGTNRKDNNSLNIAKSYQVALRNKDKESQILDLCDLPSSFLHSEMYNQPSSSTKNIIWEYIENVTQFIFVIPEYNGTYPGVLKLFVDGISPSYFNNKNAILVGVAAGRAGNIVGLEQFTTVLHHLKMEVLSSKMILSGVDKLLSENGELKDEVSLNLVNQQLDKMINTYNL